VNTEEVLAFETLVMDCLKRIDASDLEVCQDIEAGETLESLAAEYRGNVRDVLTWLSGPKQYGKRANQTVEFLMSNATDLKMRYVGFTRSDPEHSDGILMNEWAEKCGSVIAPVCKFIKHQIDRHDNDRAELREVIPISLCKREGCGKFFLIERIGRGLFCSTSCRARDYQSGLTRGERAARMKKYRETLKEQMNKPIRVAKKPKGKVR
jgi:hypothetical protein